MAGDGGSEAQWGLVFLCEGLKREIGRASCRERV